MDKLGATRGATAPMSSRSGRLTPDEAQAAVERALNELCPWNE
jgi:hypothetical protein